MCQCRCGIGRVLEGEWILKTAVILITVVMMLVELNSSIHLLTVLCTALSALCVLTSLNPHKDPTGLRPVLLLSSIFYCVLFLN